MSNGPAKEEQIDTDATDELPILLEAEILGPEGQRVAASDDDDTGEHTAHYAVISAADASKIADSRRDIEERDAEIRSLEKHIARLAAQGAEIERHLTEKDREVADLNATLASLRAALDASKAVETRLTTELSEKDAEVRRATGLVQQHEREAAARENELRNLRVASIAARDEAKRLKDALAAQAARPADPDAKAVRDEIAALKAHIDEREAAWNDLEARATAQAARIAELEREVAHRTKRQLRSDSAAERMTRRAEMLREQAVAERRRADGLAAEIERQRGERRDTSAVLRIEGRLADAEAELSRARSESAAAREKLAELQAALATRDQQHAAALAAEQERHAAELAAANERHAAELAAANDRHAAELAAAQERQAAELASAGERHAAELAAAETAARSAAAAAPPGPSSEALARLEAEVARLGAELAAEREIARAHAERLESAGADLEAAHRQLAEARAQRDDAVDHAARLERALMDKDRALDARDARIVTLQNELDEKLGALQKLHAMDRSLQGLDSKMSERLRRADPPPVDQTNTPALICLTSDVPRQYALNKSTMMIGRSSRCDIQVLTHFVSREHARLTVTRGTVVIEDLGSTNGVFVNSVRADRQELRHGDLVTIGETQFRFLESMAH